MRLFSLRIEHNLRKIIEEQLSTKQRASDAIRQLIIIGLRVQEAGGVQVQGPYGAKIGLHEVSFGGDPDKLNIYLDENLIERSKTLFDSPEESVVRYPLRLGLWFSTGGQPSLTSIIEPWGEKDELTNNLLEHLSPSSPDKVIVIAGPFGSGKSHLIQSITQLVPEINNESSQSQTHQLIKPKLTAPPEIAQSTHALFDAYKKLQVKAGESLRQAIIKQIQRPGENPDSIATYDINYRLKKILDGKQLLVILEQTPEHFSENIQLIEDIKDARYLVEATEDVAELIKQSRLSSLTLNISSTRSPKIADIVIRSE
jgi:hypothetical protein